jgi:hypothetical protein
MLRKLADYCPVLSKANRLVKENVNDWSINRERIEGSLLFNESAMSTCRGRIHAARTEFGDALSLFR